MQINLRLKPRKGQTVGWSEFLENESRTSCDKCGAKLHIAPHGGKFCDKEHEPIIVRVDKGDGSTEVMENHNRLLELGYAQGEIDGLLDGHYPAFENNFCIYRRDYR